MVETLLFSPPIPILVQMMKFSEQRKTIKSVTPLQVKISWLQHKQPVDYKPLHVGNVKLSSAKKCDVVESADPLYVEMHQNPKTSSGIRSSLHFFSSRGTNIELPLLHLKFKLNLKNEKCNRVFLFNEIIEFLSNFIMS